MRVEGRAAGIRRPESDRDPRTWSRAPDARKASSGCRSCAG